MGERREGGRCVGAQRGCGRGRRGGLLPAVGVGVASGLGQGAVPGKQERKSVLKAGCEGEEGNQARPEGLLVDNTAHLRAMFSVALATCKWEW